MEAPNIDVRAKVECLAQPETYPDRPLAVAVIETHFAWVFLAGRFVYKLKKPQRFRDFDLTTIATRRANCELEVALNRRLAPSTYLGTIPLCANETRLSLGAPGTPVDWLVKMQRLPRDRSLERLAAVVDDTELRAVLDVLAAFYSRTPRAPWTGASYCDALGADIQRTATALSEPQFDLSAKRVGAVAAALEGFIASRAELLHARIAAGRVVDAHGDLRPEHVFLTKPEPQIIDCLEFSAELRSLDTAAELSFLALECERLGHAPLARRIVTLYCECCHDDPAPELLAFYRAERAFVRAKVSAWHLDEVLPAAAAARWRARTEWYLEVATANLAQLRAAH